MIFKTKKELLNLLPMVLKTMNAKEIVLDFQNGEAVDTVLINKIFERNTDNSIMAVAELKYACITVSTANADTNNNSRSVKLFCHREKKSLEYMIKHVTGTNKMTAKVFIDEPMLSINSLFFFATK